MKVGDKITDEYLGDGEIIEDLTHMFIGGYLVKFNKTPSERYNMGQNPTLAFETYMTIRNAKGIT